MKILLVTTPRVGGTNYGRQLASSLNIPFINEPWGHTANLGYSEQRKAQALSDIQGESFVIHSQAHDVDMSLPYDRIINLQRRDIKAQLYSYIIAYNTSNFGYKSVTGEFTTNLVIIKILLMEISFQRKKFDTKYPPIFYEDLLLSVGKPNVYKDVTIKDFPSNELINYFLN
jgi:hypothetical protein